MRRIARFHKVSLQQFLSALEEVFPGYSREEVMEIHAAIRLPERATKGSAGYDFFSPVAFSLMPAHPSRCPRA